MPDASAWREALTETHERLTFLVAQRLQGEGERLRVRGHALERASPARRIQLERQRVDDARHSLELRLGHVLALHQEHLRGAGLRLHALSPLRTLGRGFAEVRQQRDGALMTSVRQVSPGDGLTVRVADGSFAAIAGPRLEEATADVEGASPLVVLKRGEASSAGRRGAALDEGEGSGGPA